MSEEKMTSYEAEGQLPSEGDSSKADGRSA